MFGLTRLYVDNYRCFVNFDFRLKARQLLLGRNGTGKSTVFEVLCALRDFSVRGLPADERFMGDTLTRWQSRAEQTFRLEVSGAPGAFAYELVVDAVGPLARPRVVAEYVDCDQQRIFSFENGEVHLFNDRFEDKVQFGFDWHRSALAAVASRPDNTKLTWFKDWLDHVVCVQINPRMMAARAEKEAVRPEHDLHNFAAWYRHLIQERTGAISDLLDSLRKVMDGFESLDLPEAGQNVRVLKAAFKSRAGQGDAGKTPPYAFDELSDGQRALVALYALLHFAVESKTLLCIDEPDNFVALGEIQPWLYELMDRADEGDMQFILVSHHPELLNQLAADCGVVFERPGFGPVTTKPFEPMANSELTPSEQIARGWTNG